MSVYTAATNYVIHVSRCQNYHCWQYGDTQLIENRRLRIEVLICSTQDHHCAMYYSCKYYNIKYYIVACITLSSLAAACITHSKHIQVNYNQKPLYNNDMEAIKIIQTCLKNM